MNPIKLYNPHDHIIVIPQLRQLSFILRLQAALRGRAARRRVAEHRRRCLEAAPVLQATGFWMLNQLLVGGLEHEWIIFPHIYIYIGKNHPN